MRTKQKQRKHDRTDLNSNDKNLLEYARGRQSLQTSRGQKIYMLSLELSDRDNGHLASLRADDN